MWKVAHLGFADDSGASPSSNASPICCEQLGNETRFRPCRTPTSPSANIAPRGAIPRGQARDEMESVALAPA
ncbi:hypothetical protein SKAU_G00271970 [Synaphobranchus kaupii]|uniref:Uncharacterized protein n=1 Tax=Synaphobranchus kaupii TaxID=118154 RepID=A0A9Q1F0J3_SYNKA|nr:hypothetical protein SKAU_G00271970 [Synaphobranchus kaupii]